MRAPSRSLTVKLVGHGNLLGAVMVLVLAAVAGVRGASLGGVAGALVLAGVMLITARTVASRSPDLYLLAAMCNALALLAWLLMPGLGSALLLTALNLAGLIRLWPKAEPSPPSENS